MEKINEMITMARLETILENKWKKYFNLKLEARIVGNKIGILSNMARINMLQELMNDLGIQKKS